MTKGVNNRPGLGSCHSFNTDSTLFFAGSQEGVLTCHYFLPSYIAKEKTHHRVEAVQAPFPNRGPRGKFQSIEFIYLLITIQWHIYRKKKRKKIAIRIICDQLFRHTKTTLCKL